MKCTPAFLHATTPRLVVLTILIGVLGAGRLEAQRTVSGSATAIYASVGGVLSQPVRASLSSEGGAASDDLDGWTLSGTVSADLLTAGTAGGSDANRATAQAVASVAGLNILNGLITADQVLGLSSAVTAPSLGLADADGSTFTNLVVAGTPVGSSTAPNTRMPLPGVGYVVLNEQTPSSSGMGLTVNMIHVVLQDTLGQTTGEIIVGSATSAVGS